MARLTTCVLDGRTISINEALDIKTARPKTSPNFRCPECNQPVRPHKAGGHASAHFEHLDRNHNCSQSDV